MGTNFPLAHDEPQEGEGVEHAEEEGKGDRDAGGDEGYFLQGGEMIEKEDASSDNVFEVISEQSHHFNHSILAGESVSDIEHL